MYTDKMVAELHEIGEFTYDSATAFAEKHGLSARSVVSKVKYEGLPYTPKVVVKSAAPKVRKADVVAVIATVLQVPFETIEGLSKADMASLNTLLAAVNAA